MQATLGRRLLLLLCAHFLALQPARGRPQAGREASELHFQDTARLAPPRQTRRASESNLGPQKDHAPRFIHQPQASYQLQPNEPHSIECPVEAQPEASVKWFKDEQPLASQAHLQLSGNELMFLQTSGQDSGRYQCQATNYLGSVLSQPIRLSVTSVSDAADAADAAAASGQPAAEDSPIQLRPSSLELAVQQAFQLTCTLPAGSEQPTSGRAELVWRRNGRRLAVVWPEQPAAPDAGDASFGGPPPYLSRQTGAREFELAVSGAQSADDNSNYTCAYRRPDQPEWEARESAPARVRVAAPAVRPQEMPDSGLGPPIEGLMGSAGPTDPRRGADQQQQPADVGPADTGDDGGGAGPPPTADQERPAARRARQLFDLLASTRLLQLVLASLLVLALLQLYYRRRKANHQHRYMKHLGAGGSGPGSSSGASGTSAGTNSRQPDPLLSSLMARTLTAPLAGASSLAGTGRKFRSYRDHMRKVVGSSELHKSTDLVDSYLAQQQRHHNLDEHQEDLQRYHCQYQIQPPALPNLYSQGVAAREQARALLGQATAGDLMRSSGNLNALKQANRHLQLIGADTHSYNHASHLDLPSHLGFGMSRRLNEEAPIFEGFLGAGWPHVACPRPAAQSPEPAAGQHPKRAREQRYQVLAAPGAADSAATCSPSFSSGSSVASSDATLQPAGQLNNHYSTIELDSAGELAAASCGAAKVGAHLQLRAAPGSAAEEAKAANRAQVAQVAAGSVQAVARANQAGASDQLSPYAVSTICHSIPAPPPPVSSEAMRALGEQFDISQLMQSDESSRLRQAVFEQAPPPPSSAGASASGWRMH